MPFSANDPVQDFGHSFSFKRTDFCNCKALSRRKCSQICPNQSLLLDPPKGKMLVTLGDRSFSAPAPYLWNSLPAGLRDIQSLAIFKCKLKTSLFRAAFTM